MLSRNSVYSLPLLAECEVTICPEEDDLMKPMYLADKDDCSKYSICYSGEPIERICAEG